MKSKRTGLQVLPEHLAQIEDARNHTYPLNLAEIPVIVLARMLSIIVHHDLAGINAAEVKTQVGTTDVSRSKCCVGAVAANMGNMKSQMLF